MRQELVDAHKWTPAKCRRVVEACYTFKGCDRCPLYDLRDVCETIIGIHFPLINLSLPGSDEKLEELIQDLIDFQCDGLYQDLLKVKEAADGENI